MFGYVILFICGIFLMPRAALAQGNPDTCEGYPETRVFLESQAWWQAPGVAFPGKHIHLGTCFPLHQQVSGVVHFDAKVHLHNMQGNGEITNVRAIFDDGTKGSAFRTPTFVNLSCEIVDCSWVIPIDVDTTRDPFDGLRAFHMNAEVKQTAEGNKFYQSTLLYATLNNGKIVQNGPDLGRSPGGSGWYTGLSYQNVFCGPNDGFDLVSAPQSGIVTIECMFSKQTAFASIDPAFHAVPPNSGTILLDSSTGGTKLITIDTGTLANGPHKLFLRTDAAGRNPVGTGSGVLVLSFTVAN